MIVTAPSDLKFPSVVWLNVFLVVVKTCDEVVLHEVVSYMSSSQDACCWSSEYGRWGGSCRRNCIVCYRSYIWHLLPVIGIWLLNPSTLHAAFKQANQHLKIIVKIMQLVRLYTNIMKMILHYFDNVISYMSEKKGIQKNGIRNVTVKNRKGLKMKR